MVFQGRANYEPNSLADSGEESGPREDPKAGFRSFARSTEGSKVRLRSETFADHYSHARLFFRSQSKIEQSHLASAIVFELSKVSLPHVRDRVLSNLRNVDDALAKRVANGLGLELPPKAKAAVEPIDMARSDGLKLIDKYPATLNGRKVAILVTDGADGRAVNAVRKAAESEGATVQIIALRIGGVSLKGEKILAADGQLAGSPSCLFDAVAIVASKEGCATLIKEAAALSFVSDAFGHLKAIGYSADAWPLLEKAGVTNDASIIDIADPSAFAQHAKSRQWDREPKLRMLA